MSTQFRGWKGLLGVCILLGAVCAVVSADVAGMVAQAAGIVSVVAFVLGSRRAIPDDRAPFRLLAGAGGAFLVGNVVRTVHGEITGTTNPFPSPADFLFFLGYVLAITGVLLLVRRRRADIEGDNILDALLLAVAIVCLSIVFVVLPFLELPGLGGLARSMIVIYCLGDAVLLSVVARLAVGSGHRNPAYFLLGGAMLCVALIDVLLNLSPADPAVHRFLAAIAPSSYLLLGAAGLHPSLARLTERPSLRDIQLTGRRLVLLFATVIGLLSVLLLTVVAGASTSRVLAAGVGAATAMLLVLARLALLVQANERKAQREAALRDAAGALAQATTVAAMYRIAAAAVVDLLGPSAAVIVERDGPRHRLSVEHGRPLLDPDASVERAFVHLGDATGCVAHVREEPGLERTVLVVPVSARRNRDAVIIGATERPVARQVLHAMETLATHVAGAIDGLLLAEEVYRQEQEQRFRALIEHSADLLTVLDDEGRIVFASPACTQLLGVPEAQLVGRHPFERMHPSDRPVASALLDRAWAVPGVLDPVEARFRHASGDWRWFEVLVENLLEQPEVAAVIVHVRDVTDRRRAQEELGVSEARFRSLVQHAADLIAIVDDDLRLTYVSPAARSMLGFEPEALVGRSITELIPVDQLLTDHDVLPSLSEARICDVHGQWRSVELTITDLRNDEAVGGIVVNARDVSERKTLEGKLRHLAMHDPLTGLANRNLLHERLAAALADPDADVALLFVDIDNFKTLNDSFGHGFGDTALCETARRLGSAIRKTDLAARLGGDEFAILLQGSAAEEVSEVATRILGALRQPIGLGSQRVTVSVSVGAAIADESSSVETLSRNADIAMYIAKSEGKDRVTLFEAPMLDAFNERIELTRDLQDVVERGELRLLYQPVYDIRTGDMTSVEALVRWHHPTRGLISPLHFIPLAEESGAICEIGSWVLDEACSQLARWHAEGAMPGLAMSVNLSVAQLEQDGLISEVERTLLVHGLEPSSLVLEVTESVLAADIDLVQLQLSGLRSLGVRLALDDFGTGYSSLGYLQHFDLDTLKIDRSFVAEAADVAQQEGLLRAIVDLAGNRGMATVAEGVELESQLSLLVRLGCDYVQGYLFARPLPADEVPGAADRARAYLDQLAQPVPTASDGV